MTNAEGLLSFDEAVLRASAELGLDDPDDAADSPSATDADAAPAVDQATPEDSTEQPDADQEASVFGELLDDAEGEKPDFDPWQIEVDLDDGNVVSVRELADGYLRQADYTRKTQSLAEERKQFEQEQGIAQDLLSRLREAPAETVAALAVEVGLIRAEELDPRVLAELNSAHAVPSREEVEAEIERRAKALAEDDPRVQAAIDAQMRTQIDADFASLEGQYGVKFTEKDRSLLMQRAVDLGVPDLRLAFLDLREEADRRKNQSKDLKSTASSRPSTGDAAESVEAPTKTDGLSIDELFELAVNGRI